MTSVPLVTAPLLLRWEAEGRSKVEEVQLWLCWVLSGRGRDRLGCASMSTV